MQPLEPRQLLSAGALDAFYGKGGIVNIQNNTQFVGYTVARSVIALPDGRSYVGGAAHAGSPFTALALARLTFDGQPDPTFGSAGVTVTEVSTSGDESANAMVVQPDGKIVVLTNTRPPGGTYDICLVRYNEDGTLDSAFGTGGIVVTDFGATKDRASKLLRQPDGRLVVVGTTQVASKDQVLLARYTTGGTLDPTFGTAGKVVLDLAPEPGGSGGFGGGLVFPDGSFLLSGGAWYDPSTAPNQIVLAKFLSDGTVDDTFGTNGQVRLVTSYRGASMLLAAPHGGYFALVGGGAGLGVMRLTDACAIDTAWGTSGFAHIGGEDLRGHGDLALQTDGSLLAYHGRARGWMLARVLNDGQFDTTFGAGGIATMDLGTYGEGGFSLALQPDGRALVVGGSTAGSSDGLVVARYRTLPDSHAVAALDVDTGIVSVTGTPLADNISVARDSTGAAILVTINGIEHAFSSGQATRVDVRLLDGNDTLTVAPDAPSGMVDAGAGNDQLMMTGVGGTRKVFGGAGNDTLTLANGSGATLDFDGGDGTADAIVLAGSAGDDVFTLSRNTIDAVGYAVTYTTPATELLTVNAQGGADRITLDATLRARTTVNGGGGEDHFDVRPAERDYYGNRLGFIPTLAGGADTDSLEYTGSALGDTMAVYGTKVTHGLYEIAFTSDLEEVLLFGGAGNDTLVLDATATATLYADGGGDSDTLNFPGSAANDVIAVTPAGVTSAGHTALMSRTEGVSISGAAGNDVITISGSAPATAVTVNGGAGDDVIDVNGATWANIIFSGGTHIGSSDTLNVNAGTFTFASDARHGTLDLTVNVATGAAVVFNATQRLAALNLDGGSARLSAAGNRVINTRGLSIANGGALDLMNNNLVLNYAAGDPNPLGAWDGSKYTGVSGLVAAGYNGGTTGIVSTTAADTNGLTTLGIGEATAVFGISGSQTALWIGQTIDATCVLIKYTYAGDANLDGQIDAGDYGIIDNFVQVPNASGYARGDFNYDGFIDAGDYGIIDNNFQAQGPPISPTVDPHNEPWSFAGEDATPAYTGSSDDIENEEDEALVESAMRAVSGKHASMLPYAVKLSHPRHGPGGSINRGR